MRLTLSDFEAITLGASQITEKNGRFLFDRFSREEAAVTDPMALSRCTAGIRLSFLTDGTLLDLKVHTEEALPIRSFFSFDILENGSLIGHIRNFEDGQPAVYSDISYPLGSFYGQFPLHEGRKQIDILFPHSVVGSIEELEIAGASFLLPVKREQNLLAFGDSITQGFDALYPSHTYAQRLADHWDMTLVNKGIGGAVFMPELAAASQDRADRIIISYGTNDWNACSRDEFSNNASRFLDVLENRYPNIPKYVLSPIWRQDHEDTMPFGPFRLVEKTLREICRSYPSVTFLSGWELVPHNAGLYADAKVHPTDEGFLYFIKNLNKML